MDLFTFDIYIYINWKCYLRDWVTIATLTSNNVKKQLIKQNNFLIIKLFLMWLLEE